MALQKIGRSVHVALPGIELLREEDSMREASTALNFGKWLLMALLMMQMMGKALVRIMTDSMAIIAPGVGIGVVFDRCQ